MGGQAGQWSSVCEAARAVPPGDEAATRAFLQARLQPYAVSDNANPQGLYTGYYEPQVDGARDLGGAYQTPIYSRPVDLIQADLSAFADELKGRRISGRVSEGMLIPY
jgi:membrane-bound lytic murein transglycosylase A